VASESERRVAANDTARLEAFSDGVFAIAITLLVLEIRLPSGHATLAHKLADTWPSYLGYVTSFVTIGIMWANHHAIFRLIARTTHGLIVGNMLLLMCVAFLPFPTTVLADHVRHAGSDQTAATVFYSGTFIVIAIAFQVLWRVASQSNRLIIPGAEAAAEQITRSYRWGIPSYTVSTLIALFSAPASLALVGAMALYWLIPRGKTE
jgi:uncharacterized membrane protein